MELLLEEHIKQRVSEACIFSLIVMCYLYQCVRIFYIYVLKCCPFNTESLDNLNVTLNFYKRTFNLKFAQLKNSFYSPS